MAWDNNEDDEVNSKGQPTTNSFSGLFPLYKHTYADTYNLPQGLPFATTTNQSSPNMVRNPNLPKVKSAHIKVPGLKRFKRVREILNAKKAF